MSTITRAGAAIRDSGQPVPDGRELPLTPLHARADKPSLNRTYETSTGSRTRSVRITTATPILAVIAISRITCTGNQQYRDETDQIGQDVR